VTATEPRPNVLDPNCASRRLLERLTHKWSILVVYALRERPLRHSELLRLLEGVSQKVLTETLRAMERDGVVERRTVDAMPPYAEYALTGLGQSLSEPLDAICRWAMDHWDATAR